MEHVKLTVGQRVVLNIGAVETEGTIKSLGEETASVVMDRHPEKGTCDTYVVTLDKIIRVVK